MDQFGYKWRFTDPDYDILPEIHLNQIIPLNPYGAKILWDYISDVDLHLNVPFKHNFFKNVNSFDVDPDNRKRTKKWLYQTGIPFKKEVLVSWTKTEAAIVPWKVVVKYFDSFYYSIGDDLTIIDEGLAWAILFFHKEQIFYGNNNRL